VPSADRGRLVVVRGGRRLIIQIVSDKVFILARHEPLVADQRRGRNYGIRSSVRMITLYSMQILSFEFRSPNSKHLFWRVEEKHT
jgi:hypothetical protein